MIEKKIKTKKGSISIKISRTSKKEAIISTIAILVIFGLVYYFFTRQVKSTANKTSDAQIKASRKWEEKNKEKARAQSYKRTARKFIKNHAQIEDLDELETLIQQKREELEKEKE